MKLLAIDTAAGLCAACVLDTEADKVLGRAVLDIGKGHAERVMGVVGDALSASGIGYDALGAVAVSVGPGSFTGVRVGVSAARGLALALAIPAAGVTTLEALAVETQAQFPGRPLVVAIGNRPQGLYVAAYDAKGRETSAPMIASLEEIAELARTMGASVAGSAADLVADALGGDADRVRLAATADIATYARIAASRDMVGKPPKPLYLRPPDARPQSGFTLPMKTA